MDNLTHGLLGATLGEAGLKRLTPLALPTLIIGANLPDVDAFAAAFGSDAALLFRRGWTHGVLALLVWPFVLSGAVMAFDRFVRRKRSPELAPVRAAPLFLISAISICSHPFLDWLNTYGVRLLSPLSDRWFYGDAVFIMDPWLWWMLAAGPFVGKLGRRGVWGVLLTLMSGLVLIPPMVPLLTKGVWGAIWVGLLAARRANVGGPLVARGALLTLVVFVGVMKAGSVRAVQRVAAQAQAAQWTLTGHTMASPRPGAPLAWDVVVEVPGAYRFARVRGLWGEVELDSEPMIPMGLESGVAQAALAHPSVAGFSNWVRFPCAQVSSQSRGVGQVYLMDARYARRPTRGFGGAVVNLADLPGD